jgi:hypothetical protein
MRNHLETKLCIDFTNHCLIYFPRRKGVLDWTHIANEGRSPQEGAKLKKMGVRAGWLDYIFIGKNNSALVAFLEAKIQGNDYSDTQKRFISVIEPMGIPYGKFETVKQGHQLLVSFGIHPIKECRVFKNTDMRTDAEKKRDAFNFYRP